MGIGDITEIPLLFCSCLEMFYFFSLTVLFFLLDYPMVNAIF